MFDIKENCTIVELCNDTYSCDTELLFKVLLNQLEKDNYKEFFEKYYEKYDYLYSNEESCIDYFSFDNKNLCNDFDKYMIKLSCFNNFICKIVEHRHDFFSSDREVKALMLVLDSLIVGLIVKFQIESVLFKNYDPEFKPTLIRRSK